MTLAQLHEFRVKHKISLTEVAAETGLPESFLERIEEGQIMPSETDLKRFSNALHRIDTRNNQPDDSEDAGVG